MRGGESSSIDVEVGHHVVQARIDWLSSAALEVDVRAGETVTLECAGQSNLLVAMARLVVHRDQYLNLRRMSREGS